MSQDLTNKIAWAMFDPTGVIALYSIAWTKEECEMRFENHHMIKISIIKHSGWTAKRIALDIEIID